MDAAHDAKTRVTVDEQAYMVWHHLHIQDMEMVLPCDIQEDIL